MPLTAAATTTSRHLEDAMSITVQISECHTDGQHFTHRAQTDDESVAISRAIRAAYGRGARFERDRSLHYGRYGRIICPATGEGSQNQYNILADRVSIDVG